MADQAIQTLQAISPAIILVAAASVMYLAGTLVRVSARTWMWTSVAVVVVAGFSLYLCALDAGSVPLVKMDSLARFGCGLALLTGLALILMSDGSCGEVGVPEYYATLLLVVAGGVFVAVANDLVLLFLGLELISVPTYVLLNLPRHDARSQEAAAKYFFLSIFASAVFLYGLSFVYGAAGVTRLTAITSLPAGLATIAVVLIVGGLSFKIAAVPFHFYAPDVYEGTTPTLAALLAWAPKAAGMIALLRLVTVVMHDVIPSPWILWAIAAATMTLGNMMALLQENLRRLFAYSSIAHTGYLVMGLAAACAPGGRYLTGSATDSVLFYLLVYSLMTLGAFAVLAYLSGAGRRFETVDDLAGLSVRYPVVALAMAVFLFSLTGIPITAGFWGKLAIFASALTSEEPIYKSLAVIGVINAAISSYYYLRIIGVMYMRDPVEPVEADGSRVALAVVATCAALTLLVGLLPGPFLQWVEEGEASLAVLAVLLVAAGLGIAVARIEAAGPLVADEPS